MQYILAIILGYRNGLIAKRKSKSTILWVFLTVLGYFIGEVIGTALVAGFFYRGPMVPKDLALFIWDDPTRSFFIFFSGLGGYLFIYYLLTRMPDKPQQDETL